MISKLLDDLRADEGWRASAYNDHRGYLTIGYGFLIDKRRGGELPKKIGDLWLEHAVEERWYALVARIPWILTQPDDVQRALGNMAYQMGVAGVLEFKLLLAALERGDRETAAVNALDSQWAKEQTPERAERVATLIRGFEVADGD